MMSHLVENWKATDMNPTRLAVLVFIILRINILKSARPKVEIRMSKIECPTHLPELVRNLSCSISSSSSFSAEFALAHDVWNTRGSYTFKIRLGSFMSNRTSVDLDLCQALETLQSEHFLRLIADEFRRVANFPVSCPFKKNTRYHIDGFAISAKFIPSYAPELSFISDCMIFINRKQAFQLTIYGSLNRTRSNKKSLSTLG